MGVGSIVLGVVSLLMMFGGILLTWLPGVGSILSFGAPVVALIGAVLGGISMSRAKQEGESGGAGMAGLIVSIIAFLFGLIFALTCGLCNALCTAGMVAGPRNRGDGGVYSWSTGTGGQPPPWLVRRDGGVDVNLGPSVDPSLEPAPPSGAPPPAFPPPPLGPSDTPQVPSGVAPTDISGVPSTPTPSTSAPATSSTPAGESSPPPREPRRRRPIPPG